jgi:hypothetical protein
MEKPYWDCLRFHGMFYDGNIHDLMALEDTLPANWKIRDKRQEMLPTIPCLACHQMHVEPNPRTALYMRADKHYMRTDKLPKTVMYDGETEIEYAADPNTRLCMQCHAPNYKHQVGSEDDCTVTGAHQGISCIACHRPHSGKTEESCVLCHSSLTDKQVKEVFEHPHTYQMKNEK